MTLQGLDAVADLCPVRLVTQESVEAEGKKTAWHLSFQTTSGPTAAMKLKPIDLVLRTYRERLFMSALSRT